MNMSYVPLILQSLRLFNARDIDKQSNAEDANIDLIGLLCNYFQLKTMIITVQTYIKI
jgi:hypothetical protein